MVLKVKRGARLQPTGCSQPCFSQCYRDLALVSRDGMNIVLNKINQILMEKYLKLQDTCRTQVRPRKGGEIQLKDVIEGGASSQRERREESGATCPTFVSLNCSMVGFTPSSNLQALLFIRLLFPLVGVVGSGTSEECGAGSRRRLHDVHEADRR